MCILLIRSRLSEARQEGDKGAFLSSDYMENFFRIDDDWADKEKNAGYEEHVHAYIAYGHSYR